MCTAIKKDRVLIDTVELFEAYFPGHKADDYRAQGYAGKLDRQGCLCQLDLEYFFESNPDIEYDYDYDYNVK